MQLQLFFSQTCIQAGFCLYDIPQFSSSDPSSQSSMSSHSGFTLLIHLLFLHLYVTSVQETDVPEEKEREEELSLKC